jgi:thiol peroxidase
VSLTNDELARVDLAAFRGKLVVLSVVPSIDTRVCESQTHHVSDAMAQLPAGTEVITVSRDLPFAQTRFKESAMTQTAMLSDYKGGAFGRAFGLEVKESGLLARSVWVIGRDGRVAYREIVADQSSEPDYDELLAAAAAAAR